MSLKKLKKKLSRKNNSNKTNVRHTYDDDIQTSINGYIKTPIDEKVKHDILLNLKDNIANMTGIFNGEYSTSIKDFRMNQLADAIAVVKYHIEKFPPKVLQRHITSIHVDSAYTEMTFEGVDLIPDKYIEVAIWGEEDVIYYTNNKIDGTFMVMDKDWIEISKEDIEKFNEGLKLL